MERAAFLNDETGTRVSCLLNPASVVVRRSAGIRPRRSLMGLVSGEMLADAPLLFTGGGATELELELFFDISLAGSTVTSEDIRDLTHPLWTFSENLETRQGERRPPELLFVWGKAWIIPVVVAAVAERLESFTPEGVPRRSWLSMRLLRSIDPDDPPEDRPTPTPAELSQAALDVDIEAVTTHEMLGGTEPGQGERLDELASRFYGNPGYWRLLANYNNIDDPHDAGSQGILQIPPASNGTEQP